MSASAIILRTKLFVVMRRLELPRKLSSSPATLESDLVRRIPAARRLALLARHGRRLLREPIEPVDDQRPGSEIGLNLIEPKLEDDGGRFHRSGERLV